MESKIDLFCANRVKKAVRNELMGALKGELMSELKEYCEELHEAYETLPRKRYPVYNVSQPYYPFWRRHGILDFVADDRDIQGVALSKARFGRFQPLV